MDEDNLPYLLALQSVPGLGPIRLKAVLDYFQNPKLAWNSNSKELLQIGIPHSVTEMIIRSRKEVNPEELLQRINKSQIKFVSIFDEAYPKALKEIHDPPVILFYKGKTLDDLGPCIAVVGTRKVTGYGSMVTQKFASYFAQSGITVVSGLARGVDSIAHKSTVLQNGRTIAVLGGGLNKIFPPENESLAREIIETGGTLISEFAPNEPSLPGNFPARNRIISALSLGVLVTEAAEGSGSLITAASALEQGKEVFAVPGPINSDQSKGALLLIKEGAKLVTEPEEVTQTLGINGKALKAVEEKHINFSNLEQRVLGCLSGQSLHVDEICRSLSSPASTVSATLVKLEILGVIKNLGGGHYAKNI